MNNYQFILLLCCCFTISINAQIDCRGKNACDKVNNNATLSKSCPVCFTIEIDRCDEYGCDVIPQLGETLRYLQFNLQQNCDKKDDQVITEFKNLIQTVAGQAKPPIAASNYKLIDGEFATRISGKKDSGKGTWQLKVAFPAFPGGDSRGPFTKQLKAMLVGVETVNIFSADSSIVRFDGYSFAADSSVNMGTEKASGFQTCSDGSKIDTSDRCPVTPAFESTLIVPTEEQKTSKARSAPMAAIVGGVVGGVVVLTLIITAIVIIRRRQATQIKTINHVQQETQLAQHL